MLVGRLRPVTRSIAAAQRRLFSAPPANLVALYESDFEKSAKLPLSVQGAQAPFVKFLWASVDAEKGRHEDNVKGFKDFAAITSKLGPLWQTEHNIWDSKEFAALKPALRLTLAWMQNTHNLHEIGAVKGSYEELVFYSKKEVACSIYVAKAGEEKSDKVTKARAVAEKDYTAMTGNAGFKFVYDVKVDPAVENGFVVNVGPITVDSAAAARGAAGGVEGESASSGPNHLKISLPAAPQPDWDSLGMASLEVAAVEQHQRGASAAAAYQA